MGIVIFSMGGCSQSPTNNGSENLTIESPLTEFLGTDWQTNLSQEQMERELEQHQQRQQEYIAQCMRESGFDYQPFTGGNIVNLPNTYDLDNRDWIMQWGYGIISSPS